MRAKIRKFKINGLPSQTELAAMPFGRQIEHLRKIEEFKKGCKSIHLSQKHQSYNKAIREAIQLYAVTEYYCDFHCDADMKDDTFEFWYR
jgi:hypothetical protein